MSKNLVDYLTSCDTIKLSSIAFRYRVTNDYIAPGDVAEFDLYPKKPKGQLRMLLDSSALGLPVAATLAFTGQVVGQQATGEPIVRWDINEPLGLYVDAYGITIDSVAGSFTTLVQDVSPAVPMPIADGSQRSFGAYLATVDDTGGFVVKLHKTIGGIDYDAELTVEKLVLQAVVGELATLAVKISVPGGGLCHPHFEQTPIKALALATGVPFGETETYQWQVTDGVIQGSSTDWRLTFASNGTAPVTLRVTVTAGSQSASASGVLAPIPAASGRLFRILCRLRTTAHRPRFFNPLWDPLRDLIAKPVSFEESPELRTLAHDLEQQAAALQSIVGRPSITRPDEVLP